MNTNRKPRHPGALIKRQYLEPLNMTVTELANILGVSRKTVSEIVNERANVTPNIALRLANAFDLGDAMGCFSDATQTTWMGA